MAELVAVQILWAAGNPCVKLSLLSFYCRVFTFPNFILLCLPFVYTWDQSLPGGHCGNQVLSYQITGALNLITDLMVLAMPAPYLWKLEMDKRQKIPLMGTFALGIFVCVATIMRLVSLSILDFDDLTYNLTDAMIWGTIEPALGVTLACVPFMKPVFPWARSSNAKYATANSHTRGTQPKLFSKKGFQRPYDPYPLQTFVSAAGETGREREHSPVGSLGGASDQGILETAKGGDSDKRGMNIMVRQEFDMR
ncbi:hypothetical protein BDV18DRAFT_159787 [Aspergillus unguis]